MAIGIMAGKERAISACGHQEVAADQPESERSLKAGNVICGEIEGAQPAANVGDALP